MSPTEPTSAISAAQIKSNFVALNNAIESACQAANRSTDGVRLIGVSKTKPLTDIRAAYDLGLRDFGENYLDEAIEKITAANFSDACWHFIGRIQSNKTRLIATHFNWVHTIDREKIARRLASQCPPGKQLNVLVQVNIDQDPAKAGVMPDTARSLAQIIHTLPGLRFRGLMTVLAKQSDARASYQSMAQLGATMTDLVQPADACQQVSKNSASSLVLSMGMTQDLDHAIHAGATHLRIGTALFGKRT